MGNIGDVLKLLQKDHGPDFAVKGDAYIDYERLPFGVFPLDLALGGGIPQGKLSMVFGPESSGKTVLCLLLVAMFQKRFPHLAVVWIDAEWAWDAVWATKLGVDVAKVTVLKPDFGEQAVEAMEALVYADDVGLIILDSIASLVPKAEIDGDVDRAQVGGNSMLISKMCRKVFAGLVAQSKKDLYPTIFCVNQIRYKIGQLHGNPETFPGGKMLAHCCNIILHTYAKDIIDKAVNAELPCLKQVSAIVKKWKVPIVSRSMEYKFATLPHNGLKVGGVESWNTVISYAKKLDYLVKDGNHWNFCGEEFKSQTAVVEMLRANPLTLIDLQMKLIAETLETTTTIPPSE